MCSTMPKIDDILVLSSVCELLAILHEYCFVLGAKPRRKTDNLLSLIVCSKNLMAPCGETGGTLFV